MSDIEIILDFLRRLAANNDRQWFGDHKEEWRRAESSADSLTVRLLSRLQQFEPECRKLKVSDCRYRIYRDTRFSADKTPYKTHIGIFINPPGGKKSLRGGYYLHLEPGNCMVGVGVWCPDSKLLRVIRQSIYDETEEYLSIINNSRFRQCYKEVGEDLLKTAPRDFPRDWKHIDLLRPRCYTAMSRIYAPASDEEAFLDEVVATMQVAKPFNDFLNFAVDEYQNPDSGADLSHIISRL